MLATVCKVHDEPKRHPPKKPFPRGSAEPHHDAKAYESAERGDNRVAPNAEGAVQVGARFAKYHDADANYDKGK